MPTGRSANARRTRFQGGIRRVALERVGDAVLRVQREPRIVPPLGEPAPPEVDPREPERALRVAARHPHEVVVGAERDRVLLDPVGDLGGDRAQHELAEHHVVDDPLAVLGAVRRQHFGELVGPERLEAAVVDVDAGQCLRDRVQHRDLHVGEASGGGDRGRDAP